MRKLVGILAVAVVLAACTPNEESDNALVIGDRFFVTQVIDVFVNLPEYMGRTIRYEGIFRTVDWFPTPHDNFIVYRYTMSCCGQDPIGFEVLLPPGVRPFDDFSWVEVTGVVEESHGFPAVRITSIVEAPDRGAAMVWR